MQLNLVSHPTTPASDPEMKVWVTVDHASSIGATATTNIWYGVGAPAENFVIPEFFEPARADKLWETTCFEAFVSEDGKENYREWNFAPAGNWAAYDLAGYRHGHNRRPDVGSPPYIRMEDNLTWWTVGATFGVEADKVWRMGLSVVLEEKNGTKSYWALTHCDPEKPDFHLADCRTVKLA